MNSGWGLYTGVWHGSYRATGSELSLCLRPCAFAPHPSPYSRVLFHVFQIVDVQFLSAMNPTAGSFEICERLQRHFATFSCQMPSASDLKLVYSSILSGHMLGWGDSINTMCARIVDASILIHSLVSQLDATELLILQQSNWACIFRTFKVAVLCRLITRTTVVRSGPCLLESSSVPFSQGHCTASMPRRLCRPHAVARLSPALQVKPQASSHQIPYANCFALVACSTVFRWTNVPGVLQVPTVSGEVHLQLEHARTHKCFPRDVSGAPKP